MSKLEKVTTRDGSTSYMNTQVGETYHSMSGAANEALFKHVQPSTLLDREDAVIADVCFGLGYNAMVAIAQHQKKFSQGSLQIFAFENDMDILNKINEIDYEEYEPQANLMRELLKNKIESNDKYDIYFVGLGNIIITLYVGDMKETIPKIADEVFDVVFFDPFSPKKEPTLWSKEVFDEMYRTMTKGAVLTTYSCARVTRTNMLAAGFEVSDGPVVGRVSPGTIAKKAK